MPVFSISTPVDFEGRFQLNPADWRHLQKTLRLQAGSLFEVYLPDGTRAEAELESKGGIHYGLVRRRLNLPAPQALPLWVGMGLIKSSRLEWAVEKFTELGVSRLSLLHLQQGRYGKPEDISSHKIQRLKKIAQETLKQCERITLTKIEGPLSLEAFLDQVETEAIQAAKIILLERAETAPLAEILLKEAKSWIILVGPEGGFSPTESQAARSRGFEPASLGRAVLRSETSAIYAACALDARLSRLVEAKL